MIDKLGGGDASLGCAGARPGCVAIDHSGMGAISSTACWWDRLYAMPQPLGRAQDNPWVGLDDRLVPSSESQLSQSRAGPVQQVHLLGGWGRGSSGRRRGEGWVALPIGSPPLGPAWIGSPEDWACS